LGSTVELCNGALPAGMLGDRAVVIFAAPEELNKTIEARC
jgi:cytochrome c